MVIKRWKPSKEMKHGKRRASSKDYERMMVAASQVVMAIRVATPHHHSTNGESVLFKFPYWVKFASDFPKGQIVSKDLTCNTYKINAILLLNWLHKKGHSPYNSAMLIKQTQKFELMEDEIDKMFDI